MYLYPPHPEAYTATARGPTWSKVKSALRVLFIIVVPHEDDYQHSSSSSLDHLSKVGHDGLLVVGSERVVAGDANSGGSVREVVPGFLGFFWWLWSIIYKIRTGLAKK